MLEINDQTFESDVLKSPLPVLVAFWSSSSAPCQVLRPVVEEFAKEFVKAWKVVKLNIDANHNTASRFAIRSIPSLLFFKQGQLVQQMIGICTKAQLIAISREVIG